MNTVNPREARQSLRNLVWISAKKAARLPKLDAFRASLKVKGQPLSAVVAALREQDRG